MATQMQGEIEVFEEANIILAGTRGTRDDIFRIINSLHKYAQDDKKQGEAEILEKLATLNTQSGQAIVAALREGRNLGKLEIAGVGIDAVPDTVENEEPAETLNAKYDINDIIGWRKWLTNPKNLCIIT